MHHEKPFNRADCRIGNVKTVDPPLRNVRSWQNANGYEKEFVTGRRAYTWRRMQIQIARDMAKERRRDQCDRAHRNRRGAIRVRKEIGRETAAWRRGAKRGRAHLRHMSVILRPDKDTHTGRAGKGLSTADDGNTVL